jgi:hypothetical protein
LVVLAGCQPADLSLMTLNMANGAGDVFRTAESRASQAAFIAAAGAQLVALQEVDLFVQRSGVVDTARAVAQLDCTVLEPEFSPDGVRRCTSPNGVILFGLSYHGDDPFDAVNGVPVGIDDVDPTLNPIGTDRSPGASYGIALLVLGGIRAGPAYVVGLPADLSQPADDPLWSALGEDDPSDEEHDILAARNLALRREPSLEPRIALVTRIARANARTLSVIVTHLDYRGAPAYGMHQLERVVAVARAERAGPPERDVVVLGDFNLQPSDSAPLLGPAGFTGAVAQDIDQIWVDSNLELRSASERPTQGVSDHANAGLVTVR